MTTTLHGLTWDHTRGYVPLVATALAYRDVVRPDVEIEWERRSLWAFGEEPLSEVAGRYDLLVIDHPLIGSAVEQGLLAPYDELVASGALDALRAQSVGPSFASYEYAGRAWALPVDASGQAAAIRDDLLAEEEEPRTWRDAVELARRTGGVAIPLRPIDALSSFFTLCAGLGHAPFPAREAPLDAATAVEALARLRELAAAVPDECFDWNPIRVLTLMATGDELAYCPLAYAYSNFARAGFAPHRLRFSPSPHLSRDEAGGTTLGGAGIAVSATSPHRGEAAAFAAWVAHAERQRTTYVLAGGQPANRVAWEDEAANEVTGGFFRALLPALDRAYLRPNHAGFDTFQVEAGPAVVECLRGERSADATAELLRVTYERTVEPHA